MIWRQIGDYNYSKIKNIISRRPYFKSMNRFIRALMLLYEHRTCFMSIVRAL